MVIAMVVDLDGVAPLSVWWTPLSMSVDVGWVVGGVPMKSVEFRCRCRKSAIVGVAFRVGGGASV